MSNKIWEDLRNKILKSITEDWLEVKKAAKEYGVTSRVIYNWLKQDTEKDWWNLKQLWEIRRLKKDKDDLLLIIWELTAELNKSKKKSWK